MSVIIDTCVLSELNKPQGNPAVRARVAAVPQDELYLSVLTLGELSKGIHKLPPSKRRRELEQWVQGVRQLAAGRILDVDLAVAERWGAITAATMAKGRQVSATDGLIAATALHHGFKIMTRNTGDFEATGVEVIDPWEAA